MSEGRRDAFTINAIDPRNGKTIEVLVRHEIAMMKGRKSKGDAMTIAKMLPFVLQHPTAIFQGIRYEEDDDRKEPGWLCYCGYPDFDFKKNGEICTPRYGKVFLIFVNSERVVYNWYWTNADKEKWDKGQFFPENYEERFREQIL